MKPEEQRIAIAEACGWEPSPSGLWYGLSGGQTAGFKDGKVSELPDYLNDLNAMHEAEKSLTPAQFRDYRKQLNWLKDYGVTAEASERAEAFLRAVGKWVNEA